MVKDQERVTSYRVRTELDKQPFASRFEKILTQGSRSCFRGTSRKFETYRLSPTREALGSREVLSNSRVVESVLNFCRHEDLVEKEGFDSKTPGLKPESLP